MKDLEREEARRLRREQGLPMNAIAARLGVAVSSVSRWTRAIELTIEQQAALRTSAQRIDAQRRGRDFLRAFYAIPDDRIGFALNCHLDNGLGLHEIERHWLESLELPETCLRGHVLNRHSRASQRKRRTLPYGTARLVVCSTDLVQSIYGSIQEYVGVQRPEFLD